MAPFPPPLHPQSPPTSKCSTCHFWLSARSLIKPRHVLSVILKPLLAFKSEMEFSKRSRQWARKKCHHPSVEGAHRELQAHTLAENVALVQLAFPGGSSVGLKTRELKPSRRLQTKPRTQISGGGLGPHRCWAFLRADQRASQIPGEERPTGERSDRV